MASNPLRLCSCALLIVVVVATGLLASTAPAPGATSPSRTVTSSTGGQVLGSGPISTFPSLVRDDQCGYLVSGNETTVGTNFAPNNPLVPNLNLSQVYSRIVSSSAFQRLAAGSSWVTLDWGMGQRAALGVLCRLLCAADFLFISQGVSPTLTVTRR